MFEGYVIGVINEKSRVQTVVAELLDNTELLHDDPFDFDEELKIKVVKGKEGEESYVLQVPRQGK